MCFGGAALGIFASMAQAVVGFAAAQQDYAAKSQQWTQNYINSLAAGRDEMRQYQLRQLQEGDAFEQKDQMAEIDRAKKTAEAETAAAGAGMSGLSVDNLVADVTRQGLVNRTALARNYSMTVRQLQTQSEGVVAREQNNINSVQRPTSPSPLAFLVQGLSGAINAAG